MGDDFASLEDLQDKVDWEGGALEFVMYAGGLDRITVAGEPLPIEVRDAAREVVNAMKVLNYIAP